jgi:hypothetical protein
MTYPTAIHESNTIPGIHSGTKCRKFLLTGEMTSRRDIPIPKSVIADVTLAPVCVGVIGVNA